MNEYQPRLTIPEEWSTQAACPVCRQKTLKIIHSEQRPDCMDCSHCGVTFEIALDGAHMRLINLPDIVSHPLAISNSWMTAAELRDQINYESFLPLETETIEENSQTPPITPQKPPSQTTTTQATAPKTSLQPQINEALSQEDVTWHIIELAKLGNLSTSIRTTMSRQGATPEQIEIGLKELSQYKRKQPAQKNFWLWVVIIVIVLCLLMSCIGLLASGQISQLLPVG
ncbi:MAG: hypothetical protein LWX83_17310 [Anaerolineae bacterium]|nr:hypothetical protein [Anaerolineae bacterium]